jgi:putative SOS response-associated peptidase YedK
MFTVRWSHEIFYVQITGIVELCNNVASTRNVWIIRKEGDINRLNLMKWGFVPVWAKGLLIGSHIINTMSETIHKNRHSGRQ